MDDLTNKIKEKAYEVGFDKVGITQATPPLKSKLLNKWYKKKYFGGMSWMETNKDKRMDVQKFYPGAKSVIMVAQNYYSPFEHDSKPGTAKISRYAWGGDYHKVIREKLQSLLIEIENIQPGIEGKMFVDTSPVMEKAFAEQAGIGWQGKNCIIVTKDFGTWIFLGGIVINKTLRYDQPHKNFCGKCNACVESCPTGALVEPTVLDARKCIGYLTIEEVEESTLKELGDKMQNWIYGCDICQQVCPWNKYKQVTKDKRFFPNKENICPGIDEILNMDEDEFKRRFGNSPIVRTGLKHMQITANSIKKRQPQSPQRILRRKP